MRAGPANDGVGSVAIHPQNRLKSGSHYISPCFLRCLTGCQPPLPLSRQSLGWRHLLRLRYNPPSENRARPLGLRRNAADWWMHRPVSSNGPLFRRGHVVWDVEGTIAAEYRANVKIGESGELTLDGKKWDWLRLFRRFPVPSRNVRQRHASGIGGAVGARRKLLIYPLLCRQIRPIPALLDPHESGHRVASGRPIIDRDVPYSSAANCYVPAPGVRATCNMG